MKPDAIILHHSATADGQSVSWGAIRKFHTSWRIDGRIINASDGEKLSEQGQPVVKPWRDIGYHFGIEQVGEHFEILVGRMADESGAHCVESRMNRRALGICFVGNFDQVEVPKAQWDLGLRLVRCQMHIYKIPPAMVFGHREFAHYKTCPGHLFDLDRFRKALEA